LIKPISYTSTFILLAVAAIMPLQANAQYHYCSWMRGTVQIPISNMINADAEVQGRMQNAPGNHNIFDERLLYSFRQWVHFNANEQLKLSISPFAYFKSYSFLMNPSDVSIPLTEEYRFTIAAEVQERLQNALIFNGRIGAEYRSFTDGRNFFRPRFRTGLRYNMGSKYTFGANYELLLQTGTNIDKLTFDNDRVWASASRSVFKNLKVELGLMHINRSLKRINSALQEGNLLVNITYIYGGA
jgi:hypothetical protein